MADDNTNAPVTQGLSDDHRAFLEAQAVDVELALALGVRSLLGRQDNPQEGVWGNWANHPAILFPWTNEAGTVSYQVRPDNPTNDPRSGKPRKYVFQAGVAPILWCVRKVADAKKILIVEGTKQALVAASYAPPGVGVYGIAGCRSWQFDGHPIGDLMAADGREVVVILDADAAENPQVYEAGNAMAEALTMEGATKVTFGRLPGGGKSGLDDVLGARSAARRADYLARIISGAKPKPADAKPKGKKREQGPPSAGDDGRTTVVINRDRLSVINDLSKALLDRWNAVELFCHGGVISRRKGDGMHPVDRGTFNDVIQETAITVNENEGANGTTYSYGWPDPNTMAAVLSRSDRFAQLDRISHAPFVRPDGTIVTEPGYDEATRTMLIPDEVFSGLEVPEDPTSEDITAARELLLTEWLGDFPFDSDVDRANVLALLITPAIRGMVPRAPLAVVDGLQMGVGKNLLADVIMTIYTGHAAEPMNWVPEADELRKQITAAFRTGAEFFVFDEAHTLEGSALAQALTAETWQDRILGVSTMANFPNRVTWMSLGNQVQVRGDLIRRVYRIAIRPRYANPQDRKAETFRHPGTSGLDLGSWTRKNRRELMTAVLTLVRAWFAQGAPRSKCGVSFGSFESWEKITRGIVETAGMSGFLDNLRVWRLESDFDAQYWVGHLGWLRREFGDKSFRTVQVREKALGDPAGYMAPPKLDDPSDKGYGKALGEAYFRLRGRRYEGMWIDRQGFSHGHVTVWRVYEDTESAPTEGDPEPEPAPYNEHSEARAAEESDTRGGETDVEPTGVVVFDLETGDAGQLHKADPATYIRLAGATREDRPVVTAAGAAAPELAARAVRTGAVVTGHNIMAFDLPALVRAGAMTMAEVHELAADGRLFDALLAARFLDPPMARDKGVDMQRKYDLGTLGQTYGLGQKLTDVSGALAKKYGGWDAIPYDTTDPDPERSADAAEFERYMVQDVELSRGLYRALLEKLGGTVPEYVAREHRVAALAAQISANGFLVDQTLLAQRVDGVNQRKAESLAWLAEHAGVPLADGKGKPYKSPLASKTGKEALEAALRAAGATSLWRTGKSRDLDTSGDHMLHLSREYQHLEKVREIAKNVYRIVGARSVYQTVSDHVAPDGRVHPKIGFEQATGRWSVTSPGLTVLGKHDGRHVERAILLPDPGEVLISVDLSQVDMRAVAGLSQDQAYIEMLKHDDPHTRIAIELFGTAERRQEAKAIGHGWNYGRGIRAISEGQEIDPALVRRFDRSMRERFPRLVEWQTEVRAQAESGALLDNGFGRFMRPDPTRAHTQGPALMGQGAARDLMMTGLLRLPAEIRPMLRAQIHDEVVCSVPADRADEIGRAVVEAFTFEWRGVPILADVSKSGTDWSLCYSK